MSRAPHLNLVRVLTDHSNDVIREAGAVIAPQCELHQMRLHIAGQPLGRVLLQEARQLVPRGLRLRKARPFLRTAAFRVKDGLASGVGCRPCVGSESTVKSQLLRHEACTHHKMATCAA